MTETTHDHPELDRRLTRLEDAFVRIAGILDRHTGLLETHSSLLETHTGLLRQQSDLLRDIVTLLNAQGDRLDRVEGRLLNIETLLRERGTSGHQP